MMSPATALRVWWICATTTALSPVHEALRARRTVHNFDNDRAVPDEDGAEFARLKPRLVTEATRLFAAPEFGIDILKVQIPLNLSHVEGFGTPTMTRPEAAAALRHAAEAAGDIPLLYLSAGVTFERFESSLKLAVESGAGFAGFMCGRAIWNDAIAIFGNDGPTAAEAWLADEGRRRLARLSEAVA